LIRIILDSEIVFSGKAGFIDNRFISVRREAFGNLLHSAALESYATPARLPSNRFVAKSPVPFSLGTVGEFNEPMRLRLLQFGSTFSHG
jgi:hypothetical protein